MYIRIWYKFGETALGFPASAAPAPVVVAPVAPAIDVDVAPPSSPPAKPSFQFETLFDSGKALIKPEAQAALNAFARTIHTLDHDVVITHAHPDLVGSAAVNQTLAEQRASAVCSNLIAPGLDGAGIKSEGRVKHKPVESDATAQGRAQTLRVDIEVTTMAEDKCNSSRFADMRSLQQRRSLPVEMEKTGRCQPQIASRSRCEMRSVAQRSAANHDLGPFDAPHPAIACIEISQHCRAKNQSFVSAGCQVAIKRPAATVSAGRNITMCPGKRAALGKAKTGTSQ